MSRVGDKVPEVTVATVVDAQPSSTKHKQFTLVVTAGPDKGRRFALDPAQPSTVLIGQSPACDIRLTDPQVSRRHASLELIGRSLRITDLGSTNGTFADRIRVVSADLQGGEFLRFGATLLRVDAKDASDECGLPHVQQFGRVVGDSAEMRRLYPLCERLAAGTIPVVIEGETGTGKEVLAESIHDMGPRASGPFVVFDCTACPPNLLEVELFGHERGAFTGAIGQRKGVFEQAHGGTLFIDEIGELDADLQPKLLRFLESGEIQPLGERPQHVDVRIVAATNARLEELVRAGRFREDLFYRLNVVSLTIPPLRERREEIPTLVNHFLTMHAKQAGKPIPQLTPKALECLSAYEWPGNVRQLTNELKRVVALSEDDELVDVTHLAPNVRTSTPTLPPTHGDRSYCSVWLDRPLQQIHDDIERAAITRAMERNGNNQVAVAAALGITRKGLYLKRQRLELATPP